MANVSRIFASIQISLFSIIILLSFIYSFSILFVQRFRYHTNIFTINLCLAITCCSLYWMTYYALLEFNIQKISAPNTCILLIYAQMMCTLQVPLAFIVVSVHRFCCIVHHTKNFFKTKRWVAICVLSQWITGFVLSLPMVASTSFCVTFEWKRIYTFIIIVIVPSVSYVVINSLIIIYVRSSSRRVRPQITNVQGTSNNIIAQQSTISRRDILLLRHMIFMFCVFIGGWGPIYIVTIMTYHMNIDLIVMRILSILTEICLLSDIFDLYVYNHEVRRYLKNTILKCFGM